MQKHLSPRNFQFFMLALVPTYFFFSGICLQPVSEIWSGLVTIIKEPDFLITDYIEIGGIGAAFINASLTTYFCIAIVYFLKMKMDGHTIASCFLMFGFSLFGKNIVNIWTILIGVWCYSVYHKMPFTKYLYIGFYGTSLSPIITQVMQIESIPPVLRFLLTILIGITIGFLLPPLSTHLFYAHKGYSLYNVGFSGGVIATVFVSLFKSFHGTPQTRLLWSTGNNFVFATVLTVFFLILIGIALTDPRQIAEEYKALIKTHGHAGTDYTKEFSFRITVFNMGVNGLICMIIVLLLKGDLNGPTMGGIFTVVGFSATGKHLRNILPIMAGVILGGLIKSWNITDPGPMLALLFCTTLAPIAGEFGVLCGILAGFLHSSVALNIGAIHAGMNLYNNGFAGGFVAAFLVPVIQSIIDRRARARGTLPL